MDNARNKCRRIVGYLNEQEIAGMEQQQWRCLKGVIDTRKKKKTI